ncbi:MAG TPA: succinate dehydrogenase [Burkholderiales bacterium]
MLKPDEPFRIFVSYSAFGIHHASFAARMNTRTQVLLWGAQRASAALLAVCVLAHLVTIIYAVRNGLTAAEILSRTSGSLAWTVFYAAFVAAVAVHAPIGLRNVLTETLQWRGRSLDIAMLVLGLTLALYGWRAVYAVVAG